MPTLDIEQGLATGAACASGGLQVVHSHHYHAALLRTLYEAEGIEAAPLFRAAAAAAAGALPLSRGDSRDAEGLEWLAGWVGRLGLGTPDLSGVGGDGVGTVRVRESHFARAWLHRFPRADHPVCDVTGGLLEALLGRGRHGPVSVREKTCTAAGDAECAFELSAGRGAAPEPAEFTPAGALTPLETVGSTVARVLEDLVPAESGAGPVEGPGSPFTALPASFYAALSEGFHREVPRARGAKFVNLPVILLQEAAHRNGYLLFGEILRSELWRERLVSRLPGAEERLGALLEVIRGLGWGSWEVVSFVASERLIVRIHDSYEAVAFERLFGTSSAPRCAVARGAAAAIMNLLFRVGGTAPPAATEGEYNRLFRSPASFRAVESRCRAAGDPFCEIVANPLSL